MPARARASRICITGCEALGVVTCGIVCSAIKFCAGLEREA